MWKWTLLLVWGALMCSCATRVEYVPVVRVQTDTLKVTEARIDSVVKHDSVFVLQEKRGDSVFVMQTKVRYRDRLQVRCDTVYKVRVDTLRINNGKKKAESKTVWEKKEKRIGASWWWFLVGIIAGLGLFCALITNKKTC